MRMPRKARGVIGGPIVAEVIEQEERVEFARLAEAEGTAKMDASPLERGLGGDDAFHWAY
jgi:hypothetical protein